MPNTATFIRPIWPAPSADAPAASAPRWHFTRATLVACLFAGGLFAYLGFAFGLAFQFGRAALAVLS